MILVTGVLIGLALAVQIVGTLFDLFGRVGKGVLVLVLAASCVLAYLAHERLVGPFLDRERLEAMMNP